VLASLVSADKLVLGGALAEGRLAPGRHQREWDGRDEDGRTVSAGVYFLRFEAGPTRIRRSLTVLR
jgi:flagellar hook assembly protein FlgD